MAKCIVVADDLTGANATGVLLKKNGFDTLTLLHSSIGSAGSVGECDCLVFPTDSRSVSPEEAYHRVREALVTLPGPETLGMRAISRSQALKSCWALTCILPRIWPIRPPSWETRA